MPVQDKTAPVTLPSEADYQEVHKRLSEAVEALTNARWRIRQVGDFSGDRSPNFEDMGRVAAFIEDVRPYVEEITHNMEALDGAIWHLDYVRIMGNVNPDADDA